MTKYFFLLAALLLGVLRSYSQSIAINNDGSKPDPHAIVDIKSSTKGVLIPRMNAAARLAIPNTRGLLVYDTDDDLFWYNTGLGWINFAIGQFSNPGIRGLNNTAIGLRALFSNTTGGFNTATGTSALNANTSGNANTANGFASLLSNTTGGANTAYGVSSLPNNTTGGNNTAIGGNALQVNSTGSSNTAIGSGSLFANTSGFSNTTLGNLSLGTNTTGSYNTTIGFGSDVTSSNLTNATAIGNTAIVNASNKVRIGNTSVTVIEGQVPFTTPSDGRFKFNVRENVKGLDFILKLRPVTYQFDVKKQEDFTRGVLKYSQLKNYNKTAGNDEATQMIRTGFIAQEVEQAAKKTGYDFDGVRIPKTEKEYYSLSYSSFVVPLVKAVQEQQQIIHSQQKMLGEQDTRIDNLEKELAEIKKLLLAK
jgi:trimeric autotransporter adhesin